MSRHIEIIARGVVERDGRILLCRNIQAGYYYLPGGHVESGESAAAALAREFVEETGLNARVGAHVLTAEVAFTRSNRVIHEVNLVFHVEQLTPPTTPTPHTIHGRATPPTAAGSRSRRGADMFHGEQFEVTSREPGIEFAWIDLRELSACDVRPASIRDWLRLPPEARAGFISDIQSQMPGSADGR